MVTKKPDQSWLGGRLWETQPAITTIYGEQIPEGKTDVTPWDPGNEPKGFAWFGDAKGKGRWGIDTASDHWDAQQKEWFSNADKWQQTKKKGPTLPGWFSGTYDPVSGKAFGSDYSGHMGWLSQGGDLTAEHYGQPGSWSMTYKMRPDGTASHTVGDVWWDRANKEQYKNFDSKAQWDAAPQFISKDPNYQTKLAEQKGRMREDLVKKLQEGDRTASDLYYWDLQHGQEDLAGGKHFTQDIKGEQAAADKAARLARETGGIVRQQTNQNKGLTLAQRLQSNLPAALQNQPNYTVGQKLRDIDPRHALKPESYGQVADVINKGASKVWDVLEAPAQSSSKIKETQDWLWNKTAVGRAKDQLLDKPLTSALSAVGQADKAPAGRKFIDYLLGDTTTKFSQKEIDDTFRSMQTAGGIVNAPGGIGHGVYGGEDISQLSYNPKTNEVTSKFGYNFQKDVDEATGRYDDNWAQSLGKLSRSVIQPLQGQYATDVGPHLPVIGSPAIQVSKMLGGARDSGQEITGSFDLLSPDMQKAVMDQYRTRQKLKLNKARGSTYNPTINRNVLRIQN